MSNQTSNALNVNSTFALEALDVFFEVDNIIDLDSLLSDFGVSVSDFDTLVFNTE